MLHNFNHRFLPHVPLFAHACLPAMSTRLTAISIVSPQDFKAKTAELQKEVIKRKLFQRTALAGKRKGDIVDYDERTHVKVVKNPKATTGKEPGAAVGLSSSHPQQNALKLLYDVITAKAAKDVFTKAFPFVTSDQEKTGQLQTELQKNINDTFTAAGARHDQPHAPVAVNSKRGAVEQLVRMLYKTIPEVSTALRPQDKDRAARLIAMRVALEEDPDRLLELPGFKALMACMKVESAA